VEGEGRERRLSVLFFCEMPRRRLEKKPPIEEFSPLFSPLSHTSIRRANVADVKGQLALGELGRLVGRRRRRRRGRRR
jgi:hypothetical protein